MATEMRKNGLYTSTVLDGHLILDFPGIGRIDVNPEKESMEARHFLLMYGRKQWIQDGGAVSAGPDGKVDPIAKFNGMAQRAELLNSGATDLRSPRSTGGPISWVTRALVALGTYQGHDTSTIEKANALVRRIAEEPKLGLGGQMGKARTWLENNSRIISAKIAELKAREAPEVDFDAMFGGLFDGDE